MSYFDDASLVMIPSGYKTSKVYSVKPTDGSGDLTFTRSNDTATRVGPDGLIEKVRTNLILQSNTFSTTWALTAATTLTSGQAGYDGTNNAWLLKRSDTSARYISQNITQAASVYTFSVYAKAETVDWVYLYSSDGTNISTAYFDLATGALGTTSGAITSKIESVGNGWYRCSVSYSDDITSVRIYPAVANGSITGGISPAGVYIQDAQLEAGDIATQPILTTSAAVSVGPVANVPRLDYLNSSCPRLLLEPQRTNLVTFSEQFDNAAWTKLNSTVSANQTQDPSGYDGADKLVQTSATAEHSIYNTITVASGTTYTASVFLKIGDGSTSWPYAQVRFRNGGFGTGGGVVADLLNGTISYSSGLTSSSIQSYGNGWYRISITQAASINSASAGVVVAFNDTSNSFSVVFAGDTNANMFLFSAQIEAGAYATSYIPTLGAAVTRGADAASKTGISSLIGQTEGTLFLDFVPQSKDFQIFYQVRTTGSTNVGQIDIRYQSSNLRTLGSDGGASQFNITAGDIVVGQRYKCAVRYQLNNVAFYVNGSLAGTDLSSTFASSAKEQVSFNENLNSFLPQALVNQALLFPTALSDAQLAELTA